MWLIAFVDSRHCVKSAQIRIFSGPYFPAFRLNTERYFVSLRIQSECRKIQTRKNFVFGLYSRNICLFQWLETCWFHLAKLKLYLFKFYPLLHISMVKPSKFYVKLISNHELSQLLRHRTTKYPNCRYNDFAKITCGFNGRLSKS